MYVLSHSFTLGQNRIYVVVSIYTEYMLSYPFILGQYIKCMLSYHFYNIIFMLRYLFTLD